MREEDDAKAIGHHSHHPLRALASSCRDQAVPFVESKEALVQSWQTKKTSAQCSLPEWSKKQYLQYTEDSSSPSKLHFSEFVCSYSYYIIGIFMSQYTKHIIVLYFVYLCDRGTAELLNLALPERGISYISVHPGEGTGTISLF